jgi:hypothetical protein
MTQISINDDDRKAAFKLELRSDDIQEILGQVPRWIVRYGTLLIFVVFLIFIFVASYLKYPDIIYARIKLTTETPPAELTANISGKIEKLTLKDNDSVHIGEVLMIIQSGAEYRDMILLYCSKKLKNNCPWEKYKILMPICKENYKIMKAIKN